MKDVPFTEARLLSLYDRVAEADDAIPRLRRFVLDLAVRGKLVPQEVGDEPGSVLLERINQAASALAPSGRKKRDTSAANQLEEEPFDLPAGWVFAPLSRLVRVLNGRAYKQQELLSEGTPVLRVGNLFTSNHWYYSNLDLDEDKYCDKGDLIYAWSASFGPFIWDGPKVIYHYHIWKMPLHSEAHCSKQYVYTYLLQKTREIKEAGHGISMVHMTKEKMEKLLVPLPPLPEQHRIVAKVEELMALLDRLEAARAAREETRTRLTAATLSRLTEADTDTPTAARFALQTLPALTTRPDQIKALRQTILNLAVRGKLVKQDPGDEPASVLLEQIEKEKSRLVKEGKIRRAKQNSLAQGNLIPFQIPNGWQPVFLGGVIDLLSGQHLQPNEYSTTEGAGVPYITGPSDFGAVGLSITRFALVRKAVAKRGQLLLTVKGSGVGKTTICELEEVAISRQLMALSPVLWSISFLDIVTHRLAEVLQEQARSLIPGISREDVEQFAFGLPPLAEQHRIVAKVEELMSLCDRLERALQDTTTTRARLLDATLREALAGAQEAA